MSYSQKSAGAVYLLSHGAWLIITVQLSIVAPSLLGKGDFSYKTSWVPIFTLSSIQEVSSLGSRSREGSFCPLDDRALWVMLPLSPSPFSLFFSLSLSSVLSQPTQPHRLTKCPEEDSALSSACFWPKYFVYILKYQPFTYSTKLSKFPWGLRLFHDKCQKDKQAISEFSPFPDSPGAIKYWLNDRGAVGGRGETLVGEKSRLIA